MIARLLLFFLYALQPIGAEQVPYNTAYIISGQAAPFFSGNNAHEILVRYLESHPQLKRALLDPSYQNPDQDWAYHTQTYLNAEVLRHLIALQIKAMAERREIDSLDDIFEPKYGIGSKSHKDKGTIKNPLSWFGHPVQKEILGERSSLKALRVYNALRKTIKNDLIRYGRNQPMDWHRLPPKRKVRETIDYLETQHGVKTEELRKRLRALHYELESLIQKVIETNLIS